MTRSGELPNYEVFALKYATRSATRAANFIGGDPHDGPMPLDYYIWVVRGEGKLFVVDIGFNEDMAIKRHRTLLRTPVQALACLGIDAATVEQIVVTHLHNDHFGTFGDFPRAQFHLQDKEMAFATGRSMCYSCVNRGYEPDHVTGAVRMVYADRVTFHDGDAELAPGFSVHYIGGHTDGLQVARVHTARGWVVLASDTSHFYEHMEKGRCFPLTFNIGDVLQGYARLEELAESPDHIIPGHDPLVMERYPAVSKELEGIAVRLDVAPST
jgi:glyoxylase-like metal-dependent hydrolase (beta-lactamase superfamily II)